MAAAYSGPVDMPATPKPAHPLRADRHCEVWTLQPGTHVTWRAVRADDARRLAAFIDGLSRPARFQRFLGAVHAATPALIAQMTQPDFRHHLAFVATTRQGADETVIGDARFLCDDDSACADFALVVADAWQGRGLGARLLRGLEHAARQRGLRWLRGDVRRDNARMLALLARGGFSRAAHPEEDDMVQATKLLLPDYPTAR
ncbi:MAG TPA: GNAT family N-acetyltransferase [Albitalea sp.]|nr:GNAT family N-acetyltransferase [Albitalea sp.]